jgi:hypothetical protein
MIAPIESSLPFPVEGIRRLCLDPKLVYFSSSYVVDAMEKRKEVGCSVSPLPKSAFADTLCFIVRKGSPYRDILNHKSV